MAGSAGTARRSHTDSLPRFSLTVLAIVHAAVMGAAARALPWPQFSIFAVLAGALAVAHLAVAILAIAANGRLRVVWRSASFLSLAFLAYVTYAALSSGLYVANLYAGVGVPLAAAAGAGWCIVAFFTLPIALWGIARTGGLRPSRRAPIAAAIVLVGGGFGVALHARAARGESTVEADETPDAMRDAIARRLGPLAHPRTPPASIFAKAPAACASPPARGTSTIIASYARVSPPAAAATCLQARTVDDALALLESALRSDYAGGAIAIDVVSALQDLSGLGPFLGAVAVRPAEDGVCAGSTCLAPWQLVGLDQFTKFQSLSAFDVKVGTSAASLRQSLGLDAIERFDGLSRIETQGFLVRPTGEVERLTHLRPEPPPLTRDALLRATRTAGLFVERAQEKDGRFHYTTDPFTGDTSMSGFGVPRQAGTTLALCDVAGVVPNARETAIRSLDMLATLESHRGEVGGIVYPANDPRPAQLGPTALTMVAFLACRDLVGDRYDGVIDRLGNGLLGMQRADGSFVPSFDVGRGARVEGKLQLYAGGQAVMALVMWEAAKGGKLSKPDGLAARIDQAMDYAAGPYWDTPIRDFFYLEENWHCMAARLALKTHRRDSYERFCVDYMRMKKRLMIEPADTDDPDAVGGYAFGTLLPPHNAATGGFGEALAAVIDVERARGIDTVDDEEKMREVLAYLVRHQWRDETCFFCTDRTPIPGGFSENDGSPMIRIDFVQHTMSGLGHGGRVLDLLDATEVAD